MRQYFLGKYKLVAEQDEALRLSFKNYSFQRNRSQLWLKRFTANQSVLYSALKVWVDKRSQICGLKVSYIGWIEQKVFCFFKKVANYERITFNRPGNILACHDWEVNWALGFGTFRFSTSWL